MCPLTVGATAFSTVQRSSDNVVDEVQVLNIDNFSSDKEGYRHYIQQFTSYVNISKETAPKLTQDLQYDEWLKLLIGFVAILRPDIYGCKFFQDSKPLLTYF
ncbi:hypothetical protein GQX74_011661 [Glossina fuscipes]|nr:hypothetical protein GQX74_011661 [Glossina fuscipes]